MVEATQLEMSEVLEDGTPEAKVYKAQPKGTLVKFYVYVVKPDCIGVEGVNENDPANQFPLAFVMYKWKANVLRFLLTPLGVRCGFNTGWKGAKLATQAQRSLAFADMRRRSGAYGIKLPF
jgi:hypothetical protein